MEDRFFKYALLASIAIHIALLVQLSFLNAPFLYRPLKNMEIAYFKMIPSMKAVSASQKNDAARNNNRKTTEVNVKKDIPTPALIKDMSKLLDKFELPKKQPAKVTEVQIKRLVSVPALKSEKINNPTYVNYYQIVRSKIKEQAYVHYSQFDTGEVYLTFVLSANGALKQVKLIDEKTSANTYLKDISLKSIQQSSPFPSFPSDLGYPELTFNVVISFEIEDY